MSLPAGQILRGAARDVLTWRSVSYFIFIGRRETEFVRISGGNRLQSLLCVGHRITAAESFPEFCIKLRKSPHYYSQPLRILINGPEAYTYMRVLDRESASDLYGKIQALKLPDFVTSEGVLTVSKRRIFVHQAVSGKLFDSISSALTSAGINVIEVVTLPIFVLANCRDVDITHDCCLQFEAVSGKHDVILVNSEGSIWHREVDTSISREPAKNDSSEGFWTDPSAVERIVYRRPGSLESHPNDRSLADLFTDKLKAAEYPKINVGRIASRINMPRIMHVGLNSVKLLTWIMAGVAAISLIAWLTTALSVRGTDQAISEYQEMYSEDMVLKQRLDTLKSSYDNLISTRPQVDVSAAIVSLFCQESAFPLFLTELSIVNDGDTVTQVTATGASSRESAIFKYYSSIESLAAPNRVTLKSVHPGVLRSQGTQDTIYTFTASMEIRKP